MAEFQLAQDERFSLSGANPVPGPVVSSCPSLSGPRVRSLAPSVTEFRDGLLQVVIGTHYSSLHPDREWIVVDTWMRAIGAGGVEVGRGEISLLTGDGRRLGLPGREEIAEELSNLGRTLIAASASHGSLAGFFPAWLPVERLPFVTRTLLDAVVLTAGRVVAGKLVFRAPRRRSGNASYRFSIDARDSRVEIPFQLPASGEASGRPASRA